MCTYMHMITYTYMYTYTMCTYVHVYIYAYIYILYIIIYTRTHTRAKGFTYPLIALVLFTLCDQIGYNGPNGPYTPRRGVGEGVRCYPHEKIVYRAIVCVIGHME